MPIVTATLNGQMSFEIEQDGFKFNVDAKKDVGGEDKGPSPKSLLLSGLIGCTGMDVVSILRKMKQPFTDVKVIAETEYTDVHPKVFKDITLKYYVQGEGVNEDKVKRAVQLSEEKYCGVSAILKKNSDIISEIYLNDSKLK